MGKDKTSVVIVEGDVHTRKHLELVIHQHPMLTLMGSAGSCFVAHALLQQVPDVALIGLQLPDGNGAELIQTYKSKGKTEFMVMTVFGDIQHIIPALEAGATGYVLKDLPFEDIAAMIMLLLEGGSPISPSIARKILQHYVVPNQSIETPFTKREQDVLELMVKGFNYTETANVLCISYHTVITYVKHIYAKLSVHSRSEAVYEASKLGFIKPHSSA